MFDSLLSFLGNDQRTASEIWTELCDLRRINGGAAYMTLPASKSELLRQLRAAKQAGLVREYWPAGAVEAVWRPDAKRVARQADLFR